MTLRRPSLSRRLRHTPLRDVLRGRPSGRLDWRRAIATTDLPGPAKALLTDVVRRTRLWRLEKAEVANELIAHFADGLAAGVTTDVLMSDFGDARLAARLMRRAKLRNRSLAEQSVVWLRRAAALLLVAYVVMAARFYFARPSPTVDHVAQLNAPVLALPIKDRAWPIYRQVILRVKGLIRQAGPEDVVPWLRHPVRWDDVAACIDSHPIEIDLIRRAAAKPQIGFVLGRGGSADDPELRSSMFREPRPPGPEPVVDALVPTLLPSVPLDRISGQPVLYSLVNGRPLIYSVGVDGDDDAGRPPVAKNGEIDFQRAAQWPASLFKSAPPGDGDWPLFPTITDAALETP